MNPPQGQGLGRVSKTLVIIICLMYTASFMATAWLENQPFLMLFSVPSAIIGLLQISFIETWFLNHAVPYIDHLIARNTGIAYALIRRGILRAWKLRDIILVFIIFGLVIDIATPIPGWIHGKLSMHPVPPHTNPISVTTLSVKDSYNIKSTMKIGILSNENQNEGPFNQYDAQNGDIEYDLETLIFNENQKYPGKPYDTLVVATALSQTMDDTHLSVNVGLDMLRGAYMAQYNYNQSIDSNDQTTPRLRLLIANFGTKAKDIVPQTVSTMMNQINLYAQSDPQHFIGIVGFPFSTSAKAALSLPLRDIPIISSASADDLINNPNNTPSNFYENFYRIIAPVSDESRVLEDFVTSPLLQNSVSMSTALEKNTLLLEDTGEDYSGSLGQAISDALKGKIDIGSYTEGQPASFDGAISKYIIPNHDKPNGDTQILFSGFANDLDALENKLNTANIKNVHIIGGEGLYDLGSYNGNNYANLVFTVNASYAQISQDIPIVNYPTSENNDCPSLNMTSHFSYEFCRIFNKNNPPTVYGYKLPGTHTLLTYDAVEAFLKALSLENGTISGSLRQEVDNKLPNVGFAGVSGYIRFRSSNNNNSEVNNTDSKPIYVVCTDKNSFTHPVGEYDFTEGYSSFTYHPSTVDSLGSCITNPK